MQSDLNILQVWSQGLSGQGVVVSVLDDGIEKDHPDLWANYVSLQGWGGGFGRRGKVSALLTIISPGPRSVSRRDHSIDTC